MKGQHAFREILLATDFSESAEAAARTAAVLAREMGARLHLVTANPDRVTAELALKTMGGRLGPGLTVVAAVVEGPAADAIVRYVRENGIDLIVMGTHGRSGFSHALLGSVTERVARTAPCPVVTVPPGPGAPAESETDAGREKESRRQACLVCARPSDDQICEPCRARIRGEALERKREQERGAIP
jgi:nucleotide-binding universal stress UspA family protein